ncbi:MAG TPA: hypothetical protein VKJ00_04895 [Thermoanaerobaculia bacterium]|nr:hypothetical protein [Thermoanaerobaculia bacterium]
MTRETCGARRRAVRIAVVAASLAFGALPAGAFDSKGHVVIEALVYRSLIEGHDGRPPQPEVLRDLFNDGALAAPICFGQGKNPPAYCVDSASKNPLLEWPRPRTDQPDAAFRRQFSDPGQCFHFMAPLADAETDPIAGTSIPRALATTAVARCRDLLDDLLRQVVVDGGPGTRKSAYGLYEMMHAIGDSFSGAHSDREPGTRKIAYLRVWKPLERIAHIPTERSAKIPKDVYHVWDDHRDKEYVLEDHKVAGQHRCKDLASHPYEVPYECLSETGDGARQALVELLILVRDARMARLAAGAGADPHPETSEAWRSYKDKWFATTYACEAAECEAKQPPDLVPGAYGLFGLDTVYNTSRKFFDVTARGSLLRYSWELNPFIYGVSADLGYRYFNSGSGSGLAGLNLDLILPLGKRAALGFTAAQWRVAFGGSEGGSDIATKLFRFDWQLREKLFLTVNAPLEFNWRRATVEWSFGLGLSYAPGSSQAAADTLFRSHSEKVERTDDTWSPPAAPYGRLLGRRPSVYVAASATTVETPEVSVPNRQYGLGSIGGALMWDRDRWDGRFKWAPAVSLEIGSRRTSGESTYLTGVLAAGLRWYVLGPLGLSFTPVRIEGGPKIRATSENDTSPDVHGSPGSQYYFQAGTRLGIAFNAGIVDLLVEAPTLVWRSQPFNAHEILTFGIGIRMN